MAARRAARVGATFSSDCVMTVESGPLRIGQLIDDLNYGGAEQVVVSLSTALRARGHEVTLFCLREIGSKPVDISAARAAGVQFVELHKPEGLHPPTLRALARELRERRVHVLHTHNHLVHHYGVGAGKLARTDVVINTLHGTSSLLNSAKWSRSLFRFAGALGDRVVAVCTQVQDVLDTEFKFKSWKTTTVDNGVDLRRFLEIDRRPARDDRLVFGTIGRLDPVKDHCTLLHAFARVATAVPHAELRILGDGSLLAELRALAGSLGIEHAVRFEGFSLDTPKFLEALDVYVISSRSEGLPLSLLEAMAAGLPIVATSVGEIPQIVRVADCGWIAPAQNPSALADAMMRAIPSNERAERGERARARAAEHYSVERMTDEYEALYRQLLDRDGSAARARK
jgi:glycosyltransferase involved in cell wall biosynthesis